MSGFRTYHPIVNFTYFVFVIGFSCYFMHPACLSISLICGFIYSVMLKGKKAIKTNLIYMIPILLLTSLLNPLFSHEGITIITYLPSGNPLTLESIIYGFFAATAVICVMCHFYCYNEVMTSDKFIYLFGKVIPSMSLVISMVFRFVPRFFIQFKAVINAQKCIGCNLSDGGLIKRTKHALNILSIMITWSLENAIDTADSMKSRGYGTSFRTSYSIFTFDKRDKIALLLILLLGVYTFGGILTGNMYFRYFPSIQASEPSAFGLSIFISYLLLFMYPLIIEFLEVIKWKTLMSKI